MGEVDDGNPGVDLVDFYFDRVPDAATLNDAEYMYWSGNGVLDDAVLWLDAYAVSESATKIPNLGWGGSVLDAQRGDGSTASTYPKLLTHTGENYLYRAGASVSNNCSVPNLAAYNPTTSFSITARVAFDNWNTPSGTNDILQRTTFADPDRQFAFFLTTTGILRLAITPTGNNASIINIDSLALNVPAGETRWVQVTFNGNDGAGNRVTTFEIAPDQETEPTSWTVNRQVTTAGTITFTPVTASMFMGAAIDTAAKYFRTIYRVGGVVQMDANFTTGIIDGDQTSFVESSTNAATVTINRAASGRKSVAVTRPTVLFGTDDYWEVPADPYGAYVQLPGALGSYISTPDAAGLDITGDIEIVTRVSLDSWTPAAEQYLVAKYTTTGNQRSYALSVTSTGRLAFRNSVDGINAIYRATTNPLGFADRTTVWLKITLDVNTGSSTNLATFQWAPDQSSEPTVWTTLDTVTATIPATTTTSIYSGSAVLEIGSITAGASSLLAGKVYRAIVRNGIGGTTVADWWAAGYAEGTTVFTDTYLNPWTLNGSTELFNPNPLNFGANDSFTVFVAARVWGTTECLFVSKKGTRNNAVDVGWWTQAFATTLAARGAYADGTNVLTNVAGPSATAGNLNSWSFVRDTVADTFASNVNTNAGTPVTDTMTASLANSLVTTVGVAAGTSSDMELFAVAVWRRALTADEIAAVAQYYEVTTSPSWVHLLQLEDGTPLLDESGLPIELE